MKGTEKQIAWAEDIREQAILACDCIIRNSEADGAIVSINYVDPQTAREFKASVENAFAQQTDAKAIIDNRQNFTFNALVKMARSVAKANGRI